MIRRLLARSLWYSGACDLARHLRGPQGLVLRYHSICADTDSRPDYVSRSISVPATLFEQQISRLSRTYRCLSLDEVVDCVERRQPLPPRTVVVTFDDGYLDNYVLAMPILARYRVPATVYLVSSTLTVGKPMWTSLLRHALATTPLQKANLPDATGRRTEYTLDDPNKRDAVTRLYTNVLNILSAPRRDALLRDLLHALRIEESPGAERWFLTVDQVREMARNGVSFGGHTITHPNLPGIDKDEARHEIEGSKSELEACLGVPCRHFSYPNSGGFYPHFNDVVEAQVRAAGFRSAATSVGGALNAGINLFRMERIDVNRSRSPLPEFSLWLERNRLFSEPPMPSHGATSTDR